MPALEMSANSSASKEQGSLLPLQLRISSYGVSQLTSLESDARFTVSETRQSPRQPPPLALKVPISHQSCPLNRDDPCSFIPAKPSPISLPFIQTPLPSICIDVCTQESSGFNSFPASPPMHRITSLELGQLPRRKALLPIAPNSRTRGRGTWKADRVACSTQTSLDLS